MDHFGIGSAYQAMSTIYRQSARQTGRTTLMIKSLKSGDRVIFTSTNEADRVRRLAKQEYNKDIECIVVNPRTPELLRNRGSSQHRTIFDHSWVEQYYKNTISFCESTIDWFQTELSNNREPPRETERREQEMGKWER